MLTKPSGEYFTKRGHVKRRHWRWLVLEKVRNSLPFIVKTRDYLLVKKFDIFIYRLNQEPGTCRAGSQRYYRIVYQGNETKDRKFDPDIIFLMLQFTIVVCGEIFLKTFLGGKGA